VRKKLWIWILLGSLGLVAGCGGGGGSSSGPTPPPPNGKANVLAIAVDGGPTANQTGGAIYTNGVFASATVCVPGSSSNCVTVGHLLVDTGSYGLRVLETAIPSLKLPAVNAASSSAAYNCVSFVDGSFLWGPVEAADVTLAGETASNVPIQVISSSTLNIPTSCSNNDLHEDENTQSSLGANGILGVGLEPSDCGLLCDPSQGGTPPAVYYTCSNLSCTPAFINEANQVTNPVVMFANDHNGVIVELPKVSGSAATVTGSLIFGIGTESNNQLSSSATVFTVVCDSFTTIFESETLAITDPKSCSGPGSFIDSGSNGLYFPDVNNSIPTCSSSTPIGDLSSFYCPPSLLNLSATNESYDQSTSKKTNFSVSNALSLFTSSSTDAAFSTLGGLNPMNSGFDWGLPFFYGVNVYSAIDTQNVSGNVPGPWWAY